MVERCGGTGLLLEASQMIWVTAGGRTDDLEGDVAAQSFVARPKDLAHRPNTNLFEDPVMSD